MNKVAKIEQAPAAITPMMMLQTAVDQGADLDKLTKLMDLQERWEANEAKKAFVAAMNAFQEKAPTIDKTRDGHNIKYAGLAETLEQIRELMTECGLSHSWKTLTENGFISVTCCVTHALGHQECTTLTAGADDSGKKNAIQAMGSTVSYLQRYTLYAILGLASKEQDDDGGSFGMDTITTEQAAKLDTDIVQSGADRAKFYNFFKISDIRELPAAKYADADAMLAAKLAKKGAAK